MNIWRTVLASVVVVSILVGAVVAQPPQKKQPGGPPAKRMPGGPPDAAAMALLIAIDVDRDGKVSAEEILHAAEALKKLDKDGDGSLSREELRPPMRGPGGLGGPGGPGFPGGPGGRGSALQAAPLAKDDAERKILDALKEIRQKQGNRMNVPELDGRILRLLAEQAGAKTVVEIGTSNGISAIWLANAVRKTGGRVITHEIDPETAAQAKKNFVLAGVADVITVVEGDAHEMAKELKGPIDLVFIDADKEGYLDYLKKLLPLVRPGGVVTAHNMNPRMADPEFVKAITTDPNLETIFYNDGGGLAVTLKKR